MFSTIFIGYHRRVHLLANWSVENLQNSLAFVIIANRLASGENFFTLAVMTDIRQCGKISSLNRQAFIECETQLSHLPQAIMEAQPY